MNLLKNVKIFSMIEDTTGTANIASTAVLDMSGYDGVMWIGFSAGNTNSTGGYNVIMHMHGDSSGSMVGSTASTDMYASNPTTAEGMIDNQVMVLDVYKPLKRYVSVTVGKDSTNDVELGCIGIQYRNHSGPTSQFGSTEIGGVYASSLEISPTT